MAYLVTTAGAHGRRLIFKKENGELYYAADGKEFSGILVFQTVDGTNKKRIFSVILSMHLLVQQKSSWV